MACSSHYRVTSKAEPSYALARRFLPPSRSSDLFPPRNLVSFADLPRPRETSPRFNWNLFPVARHAPNALVVTRHSLPFAWISWQFFCVLFVSYENWFCLGEDKRLVEMLNRDLSPYYGRYRTRFEIRINLIRTNLFTFFTFQQKLSSWDLRKTNYTVCLEGNYPTKLITKPEASLLSFLFMSYSIWIEENINFIGNAENTPALMFTRDLDAQRAKVNPSADWVYQFV